MGRSKKARQVRGDIGLSLSRLADIPKVSRSLVALAERTAAQTQNTKVLSFSLNYGLRAYQNNIDAYKMKPDKAREILRVSTENACALHCEEMTSSLNTIEMAMRDLELVPKGQSVLDGDPHALEKARQFVRVISVWRSNGGKDSYLLDRRTILWIVENHGHEIDRAIDAIRAHRSVTGLFIGAMDSVSTPLLEGAL